MQTVLEKLEQVMQSELAVHDDLLASSREFNRAIRENDIENIDRQRSVQDATICRIEKLESERRSCCAVLAQSYGIVKQPLKLAMLIEKVPKQWCDRLGELQRALKDRLAELAKISASNRILLEEGMRMVQATFGFVRQAAAGRYCAYGKHGRTVAGPAVQSIINRTI